MPPRTPKASDAAATPAPKTKRSATDTAELFADTSDAITKKLAELNALIAKLDGVKVPKSIPQCADLYYTLKNRRLAADKVAEALAKPERFLREHLINTIPKSDATGVAGKVARVQVVLKAKPVVEDWPAFYAHVKKTGNFELMQKRLSDSAVKERWDAGKTVPGVGTYNDVTLSVTKVK